LNVEINQQQFEHIRKHSSIFDSPKSCRTETFGWLGNRIYREFRRMDEFSALAIEGLILEILAEGARQTHIAQTKFPDWLERAREFLHDNFAETVNLETISANVGVHPVHLARAFRQHYNCTVGEYVRRLRVEFACSQIIKTDVSLNEIAVMAGFSDQSHLTRIFKRHFGLAPSEYRKISHRS
jgi:AraC family transcriptional regulator